VTNDVTAALEEYVALGLVFDVANLTGA